MPRMPILVNGALSPALPAYRIMCGIWMHGLVASLKVTMPAQIYDMLRSAAGHTQASTTARYVRGTIGKSRKVAELRQAHREAARKHDVNDK